MSTRRTPSIDTAGKMIFEIIRARIIPNPSIEWSDLSKDDKKKYVKMAIEVWRDVEKCL